MIDFQLHCLGLSIHRLKKDEKTDGVMHREIQTLQMELQQIMKGLPVWNIDKHAG